MWYHLSYDIVGGSDEDYEDLFKQIRKFPAYSHVLKSSWIVSSNKSASVIRDELTNAISADIRILVTGMRGNDAAFMQKSKVNYLVKNLDWTSD